LKNTKADDRKPTKLELKVNPELGAAKFYHEGQKYYHITLGRGARSHGEIHIDINERSMEFSRSGRPQIRIEGKETNDFENLITRFVSAIRTRGDIKPSRVLTPFSGFINSMRVVDEIYKSGVFCDNPFEFYSEVASDGMLIPQAALLGDE